MKNPEIHLATLTTVLMMFAELKIFKAFSNHLHENYSVLCRGVKLFLSLGAQFDLKGGGPVT